MSVVNNWGWGGEWSYILFIASISNMVYMKPQHLHILLFFDERSVMNYTRDFELVYNLVLN